MRKVSVFIVHLRSSRVFGEEVAESQRLTGIGLISPPSNQRHPAWLRIKAWFASRFMVDGFWKLRWVDGGIAGFRGSEPLDLRLSLARGKKIG